jgi:RNA polymerase sigma factor (sigma-70 family)
MARAVSSPILQLIRRVVEDRHVRQLSDHELLLRFADQQDEAAFHTLLCRHGPMVLNVCRGVLANEADAEDAFQATFLILAGKVASIRKTASVGSWLHGVAYRTALKARARLATRQKHESNAVPPPRQVAEPDEMTWREIRQVMHEELAALAERYRVPLVACYLEGTPQDAAAAQLGLARSTLKERLERGRALLRARLVRRGLRPAGLLFVTAWPSVKASACVPASLVCSTLKAASLLGSGQATTAGIASVKATAQGEGAVRTMLLTRLKIATAMLFVFGVGAIGTVAALLLGQAGKPADRGQTTNLETAQAPAEATGPAVVTRARKHEVWFKEVKSFHARLEATVKRSPEEIDRARRWVLEQHPADPLDPKRYPEIRPEVRYVHELAFDGKRVWDFREHQDYHADTAVWDGEKVVIHDHIPSNPPGRQHEYALRADLKEEFRRRPLEWSWPRSEYHPLWFMPAREQSPWAVNRGTPEEYELTGRQIYRGIPCWVVERRSKSFERWYIGEGTGLVHCIQEVPLRGVREVDRLAAEVARKHGGNCDGWMAFFQWSHQLPDEKRDQVRTAFLRAASPGLIKATIEHWNLDYQEIAPGRFFPMKQGKVIYQVAEGGKVRQRDERVWMVTKLVVDGPLADDLFRLEILEGAAVSDSMQQQKPVRYFYRKGKTLQELRAEAGKDAAKAADEHRARVEAKDALVGKPAFDFAQGAAAWTNTRPLNWAGLKGKVVVLDFWAIWCAPCRNDLPRMREYHDQRDKSGIVVIGVHASHDKVADIEQFARAHKLVYPIYLDRTDSPAAGGRPKAIGDFFDQYKVSAIPDSVVVDQNGRIAGHGRLEDMWQKARELAAAMPPRRTGK